MSEITMVALEAVYEKAVLELRSERDFLREMLRLALTQPSAEDGGEQAEGKVTSDSS